MELFDPEERSGLIASLRAAYLERSGLAEPEFAAEVQRVLAAIDRAGFRADRLEPGSCRVELLELLWEPIRLKAEELARASARGGAGNILLFGALLGVLLLDPPFLAALPAFLRSLWVKVFVGGGVLVGAVHFLRGRGALEAVRLPAAAGPGAALPPGSTLVEVTGKGGAGSSAEVGPPLLGALGLAAVLVGGVAAASLQPLGIALMAATGLVLLLLMRLVLLGFPRPAVKPSWTGARSAWGALICWQLAVVAGMLSVRGFTSGQTALVLLALAGPPLAFGLARVGSRFWATARRRMSPTAEQLLAADRRPAMLYLRSFASDSNPASYLYSPQYRRYDVFSVLSPAAWIERRDVSFEEIVCRGMSELGPVVAIGKPGEPLPRLGAARKYVAEAEWQEEVRELARRCRLVTLLVGSSGGVLWEFEQLIERGDPEKVLLVFPQGVEYGAVWEDFVASAASRARRSRLPGRLPGNALALAYRGDGGIVLFTGPATAGSYREISAFMLARR